MRRLQLAVQDPPRAPVGAIGLERHGSSGLLRSLVVAPSQRGRGVGGALVASTSGVVRSLTCAFMSLPLVSVPQPMDSKA